MSVHLCVCVCVCVCVRESLSWHMCVCGRVSESMCLHAVCVCVHAVCMLVVAISMMVMLPPTVCVQNWAGHNPVTCGA